MPARYAERVADQRFYPPINFASLDDDAAAFERARVVVLPVPYDSTVTGRAGTRDGPRAIIEASADMELYDVGLASEPWRHGIHTLPELAPHTGSPEAMAARIEEVVGELIDAGKFVVTLGGEHTVAVGAVRAHARRRRGCRCSPSTRTRTCGTSTSIPSTTTPVRYAARTRWHR